ncbi:MAG: CHAT domain-containing protein, partial [Acidobacteriota bacterium]
VERRVRADSAKLPAAYALLNGALEGAPGLLPWTLWARGTAEQLRGHPAAAEPLLGRARAIFRRAGDLARVAQVDLMLMDALACLGRQRAASRHGSEALRVFTAAGDRAGTAAALINLGGLADGRDRLREALAFWRRARRVLPPDERRTRALLLANQAGAYQALGYFRRAAAAYDAAAVALAAEGCTATALQARLGSVEVRGLRGDPGVLAELNEIAGEAERLADDNLLFEARLTAGRLELLLGHPERALALADAMAPRCVAAGRHDTAAQLDALAALASLHLHTPDATERIAAATGALCRVGQRVAAAELRVEAATGGIAVPAVKLDRAAVLLQRAGLAVPAARARVAAARALLAEGRPRAAAARCREALQCGPRSPWVTIEACRTLAAAVAPEDTALALRHLRRAVRDGESVRSHLAADLDRAAFAARLADVYAELVALLLCRGDSGARREAFALVARAKSRGLAEALEHYRGALPAGDPELLRRWEELRHELGALLAAQEGRGGEWARQASRTLSTRIHHLCLQLEDVQISLDRSQGDLTSSLRLPAAATLRGLLRQGDVYLEWFFSGRDLVTFHLTRAGLRAHTLPGARERVEGLAEAARFQLSKAAFGRRHLETAGERLVAQARGRLAALGELLLAPLAHNGAASTFYLAPHGPLHGLPLSALELGGQPLVLQGPVAVLPGARVLAAILRRPSERPRRFGVMAGDTTGLPEVRRELADIGARLPGVEVAEPAPASELRALLGRCDAVHVGAHGAFQPSFPASSGLRLRDGWFTALDLLRTPVAARLVTLGACASGEVSVLPGEELMGILRAIFARGVRTAVLAPGTIDDTVARQTTALFYEHLLKLGAGEALRRSQLAVRESFPHPALWASLQLYGDPRPWEES